MRCNSAPSARRQATVVTVSSPLAGLGRLGDEGAGEASIGMVRPVMATSEAPPQVLATPLVSVPRSSTAVLSGGRSPPLARDLPITRRRSALILSAAEVARSPGTTFAARAPLGAIAPLVFALAGAAADGVEVAISLPPSVPPPGAAVWVLVVPWSREPPCPNGSSSLSSDTPVIPALGACSTLLLAACAGEAPPKVRFLLSGAVLAVHARLFHELEALSKAAVTTILVRGASPPPASRRLHGCLPASMRRMARAPAVVGAPHCLLRRNALRLLQAPHRRQNTKGNGPPTLDSTCPLAAHWLASASALFPVHLDDCCLGVSSSVTVHVLQMAQRHFPASNCQ